MRFNSLIFCILLSFICSCSIWTEGTRKLAAENAEQDKIKPINICDIEKSSNNIKATISINRSVVKALKSIQSSERLKVATCFSQPHPNKQFVGRTPWGKRLWFDFTHFYGLANGLPGDEYPLKNEAIKNCEILLSDYRSKYKNFTVPASCRSAKCQVCEY